LSCHLLQPGQKAKGVSLSLEGACRVFRGAESRGSELAIGKEGQDISTDEGSGIEPAAGKKTHATKTRPCRRPSHLCRERRKLHNDREN